MFIKENENEILERLTKRKSEIKNLKKLPILDEFYLSFLSKYESIEITPDIDIFGYEMALKENRNLETNFPNIFNKLWMIGRTGQGDEWFISRENGRLLFYDHNQGEYSNIEQFVSLNISFLEFLQMAFLYQELENLLDEQEEITKKEKVHFTDIINSIQSNLYELYPFKYW